MEQSSIISALNAKLGSNVESITIPSLQRKVDFRPITLGEQKTLAKLLINAGDDEAESYKIFLSLIQNLALSEDFEVKSITDIDRIVLLIELYCKNYFKNELNLTCPECKKTSKIHIDFSRLSEQLSQFDFSPRKYTKVLSNGVSAEFTCVFPLISSAIKFFELSKDNDNKLYEMEDFEKIFISNILVSSSPEDESPLDIDVSKVDSMKESIEILDSLPFEFYVDEESGSTVIDFISEQLIAPTYGVSYSIQCEHCKKEIKEAVSIESFFTLLKQR